MNVNKKSQIEAGSTVMLSAKSRVAKKLAGEIQNKIGFVLGFNSKMKTWHVKFNGKSFHLKGRDLVRPYKRPYKRHRPEQQQLLWRE